MSLVAGSLMSLAFLQVYLDISQHQLSLRQSRQLMHTDHVLRRVLQAEFDDYIASGSARMVSRWHHKADFDRPTAAISGSDVIRINGSTFYIAHRGRRADQPAGLYRRRDRPASGYYPGEEIVEGVTSLQLELCDTRCDEALDELSSNQLTGLRIHYELRPDQRLPGQQVLTLAAKGLVRDDVQRE
ncbi:hypothetical protein [Pseudohongiella spirulinae]|uniref:hypothetical protein n=1 Tax=Pseudohongiella spirulinae TaxID=1249552 RepID=UPI0012E3E2CD|nr:hypothetical protein [Pseudohongiella spirulinae]